MRPVFADTLYWIAITRPGDQWQGAAKVARAEPGQVRLVTTDEVLTEFTNALSAYGDWLRALASRATRAILADPKMTVLPQCRESFLQGLDLHESRPDKAYSLTDCISMVAMRQHGIMEILTHDHHLEQEGFAVLIRPR